MTRLLHFTDIHFTAAAPSWNQLRQYAGKRILGLLNLHVLGRQRQLSATVQHRVLDAMTQYVDHTDCTVFTGDCTSLSLPAEFEAASAAMRPLFDASRHVLTIPGNHDVYTTEAAETDAFGSHFNEYLHPQGPLQVHCLHDVTLVGLNPCRPTGWKSSGWMPQEQLEALRKLLQRKQTRHLVLAIHYPIVNPADGKGYHLKYPIHGIENGAALIGLLEQAVWKPQLILHGHVHHPSTFTWNSTVISNPGCAGYALDKDRGNVSGFHTYTFSDHCLTVERIQDTGKAFEPVSSASFPFGV